jgi:hypothetical protein
VTGVARTPLAPGRSTPLEHAPRNVLRDAEDIARFHDRCSDLMRELLEALASTPGEPRPFGAVEDELGWPRRRISSMLGGVAPLRHREFEGRRPYHLAGSADTASRRWEIWVDRAQAAAIVAARELRHEGG